MKVIISIALLLINAILGLFDLSIDSNAIENLLVENKGNTIEQVSDENQQHIMKNKTYEYNKTAG
ncbi:hypothetical protein [Myroides pelagicus]|uniref:Uncharacterized protein n=1 Tax=Myroides pelagicus TaxID=270914 RepID=A0A7K1GN26_9FLAO|nr:hypothetical protein [Myroides pelagicus]MEC4114883.1 hypothetical protein [Myroides pelagicus]MTH30241.1 hypothetical protein [Myroides pelagicus]